MSDVKRERSLITKGGRVVYDIHVTKTMSYREAIDTMEHINQVVANQQGQISALKQQIEDFPKQLEQLKASMENDLADQKLWSKKVGVIEQQLLELCLKDVEAKLAETEYAATVKLKNDAKEQALKNLGMIDQRGDPGVKERVEYHPLVMKHENARTLILSNVHKTKELAEKYPASVLNKAVWSEGGRKED